MSVSPAALKGGKAVRPADVGVDKGRCILVGRSSAFHMAYVGDW